MYLVFDNAKTIEKKKGSKYTYALRTQDDDPIKVRLTIEAETKEELEQIIKKTLERPVEITLKNL